MAFNRLHEFERVAHKGVASEVEESLRKHLQESQFSPNASNYYVDEIKAAFGGMGNCVGYNNAKKPTVADMVDDLMKRTGLIEYIDEIQASIKEGDQTTKKAEQAPQVGRESPEAKTEQAISFANVPEMRDAIEKYVSKNGAFQYAPVLKILKDIKMKLIENKDNPNSSLTKLPERLVSLEPKDDEMLLALIKERFAKHLNGTMIDSHIVEDLTSSSDSSGAADDGEADAAWKGGGQFS